MSGRPEARGRQIGRALAAIACALALQGAPVTGAAAEYTIGVIPPFESRRLFETWRPIAAELERRTGHTLRLVTSLPMKEFEAEFMRGGFDFVYMNPYFVGRSARAVGYVPLVRDRTPSRGALVVRKGSGYRSPSQLQGRRVAFHGPNAIGASLLMKAELKSKYGVEVEPVYVGTAPNAALHVAKGLAEAAGVPEKVLPLLDPALRAQLEVLFVTTDVPPHALCAHARVPASDREGLRRALLDLAATDAGRALLAKVPMVEAVPASLEEYTSLTRLGLGEWFDPGALVE